MVCFFFKFFGSFLYTSVWILKTNQKVFSQFSHHQNKNITLEALVNGELEYTCITTGVLFQPKNWRLLKAITGILWVVKIILSSVCSAIVQLFNVNQNMHWKNAIYVSI